MTKKFFTDESLATFVNETKTYADNAVAELSSIVVYASDSNENVIAETDGINASEVSYVNTASGLSSTNVQSAIDELSEETSQLSSEKVDKASITLGVHTDGLVYIFVNGSPKGNGLDIQAEVVEGDVFGYVDENNTIVLNGSLADDTYTVKYEMKDGTTVNIGTLEVSNNSSGDSGETSEPKNYADTREESGWKTGYRLSGGDINTDNNTLTGGAVTNYVSVKSGDTIKIEGINFTDTSARFGVGKADKTNIMLMAISDWSGYTSWVSGIEATSNSLIITILTGATTAEIGVIRASGILTGTAADVVINIKRDGKWLTE